MVGCVECEQSATGCMRGKRLTYKKRAAACGELVAELAVLFCRHWIVHPLSGKARVG